MGARPSTTPAQGAVESAMASGDHVRHPEAVPLQFTTTGCDSRPSPADSRNLETTGPPAGHDLGERCVRSEMCSGHGGGSCDFSRGALGIVT